MPHRSTTDDMEICPVPELFFSRLIVASQAAVNTMVQDLPEDQRSRLAIYCYRRNHLRRLGLLIAASCSKRSLSEEGGHAGELIHIQAQDLEGPLAGDRYMAPRYVRRPVSLYNC